MFHNLSDVTHTMIRSALVCLCLFLLAPPVAWSEDMALGRLFSEAGVTGTIIIAPLHGGEVFVHDERRSSRRFPVASTFKILNTLIALEEGAIAEGDTFTWDGVAREVPGWNGDQTLDSAFRLSCVWCYQTLARRVGAAKYQRYLAATGYGELSMPFDETTFWLDGSLQISATGQIEFLKAVYRRSLPFSNDAYKTLRRIMLVEQTPQHGLWAKTGWAARGDPGIGWYVGYVETARGTWFFALNLDIRNPGDLPLRQKIAREALRAKGIIH
jgi:beta-lactamase class D